MAHSVYAHDLQKWFISKLIHFKIGPLQNWPTLNWSASKLIHLYINLTLCYLKQVYLLNSASSQNEFYFHRVVYSHPKTDVFNMGTQVSDTYSMHHSYRVEELKVLFLYTRKHPSYEHVQNHIMINRPFQKFSTEMNENTQWILNESLNDK